MKRTYDKRRWRRLRRQKLSINPLCEVCNRSASDVDHIETIDSGGNAWDMGNLQSLCKECHSRKTSAEKTGRSWEGAVGADGLPIGGNHWWGKKSVEANFPQPIDELDFHF